ncbi:MAG: tetratricopeptide (TPR) repeat protein, partial [Myxococcota bacterium]
MALMLLIGSLTAQADEESDLRARQLYDNGAILYDEGRYEDAVVAWQEAWNLSERPLLLYNIANAQERLGLWRDALETLNRYRAFAKPEERDKLDRRITNLERRLEEEGLTQTNPVTPGPITTPPVDLIPVTQVNPVRRTGWIPLTAYSVGGAGLVAGTVFGLQARSARETATSLCQTATTTVCPDSATDALSRDASRSLLADGAFL